MSAYRYQTTIDGEVVDSGTVKASGLRLAMSELVGPRMAATAVTYGGYRDVLPGLELGSAFRLRVWPAYTHPYQYDEPELEPEQVAAVACQLVRQEGIELPQAVIDGLALLLTRQPGDEPEAARICDAIDDACPVWAIAEAASDAVVAALVHDLETAVNACCAIARTVAFQAQDAEDFRYGAEDFRYDAQENGLVARYVGRRASEQMRAQLTEEDVI